MRAGAVTVDNDDFTVNDSRAQFWYHFANTSNAANVARTTYIDVNGSTPQVLKCNSWFYDQETMQVRLCKLQA